MGYARERGSGGEAERKRGRARARELGYDAWVRFVPRARNAPLQGGRGAPFAAATQWYASAARSAKQDALRRSDPRHPRTVPTTAGNHPQQNHLPPCPRWQQQLPEFGHQRQITRNSGDNQRQITGRHHVFRRRRGAAGRLPAARYSACRFGVAGFVPHRRRLQGIFLTAVLRAWLRPTFGRFE